MRLFMRFQRGKKMLKIIADSAEFDISAAVRQEICGLLSSEKHAKNIVFIVPDQFEFETEKAIYGELLNRNLLTRHNEIHIETFSSLSEKILADAGDKRIPADDTIKNILMHKAVREQKTSLGSLSRQADKSGFCKKMLSTISMLKMAGFSPAKLDESYIQEKIEQSNSLKNHRPIIEKLRDVSKIQASYEACLNGYIDRLDAVSEAAEIISSKKNGFFENADVFVDCFNDFTGNQMQFLMKLSEKAKNLTLGFTVKLGESNRENLFLSLTNQIEKILENAKENGAEIVIKSENLPRKFDEHSPLSEISEKIFSDEKSEVLPGEACEIVRAANSYEEIDYTAAKIKELCLDKGYLYREIAVLCASSSYGKYIKSAFEKYEIPFFLDMPEPILYQPIVNLFLSLINVLRSFTADSVLSLIKTGFMSKNIDDENGKAIKRALSKRDIDDFESYIFEWNLKAKHLKNPFVFGDQESFGVINAEAVRKAVVEPILNLRNELKNKDGSEITRLIYRFAVDEVDIERTLYSRCLKQNSGETDTELLRVNQQVWNSLAVILETLERELKNEIISLDEYYQLFTDICSGTVLAKPPQFQDCVLVGDIDRTRAEGIKCAFILSATYEKFPTVTEGAGIFSEIETEFIKENISEFVQNPESNFTLKSVREQYCLSLYRAYRAVSLPVERLTIISPDYDEKGAAVQRSQVIDELFRIFPSASVIDASKMCDRFYCRSVKAAKQRYAGKIRTSSYEKTLLKNALKSLDCGDFVDKLDEIKSTKSRKKSADKENPGKHNLLPETAQRLFSKQFGATSVEKLSLCKFKFFCENGLNISEKNQRIFNESYRGNAVHFVLQTILEEYYDKLNEFYKLTRDNFVYMAQQHLSEFCRRETNGDFDDDKRAQFLFLNLANAAADVLITLQAEFAARKYRPKFFELNLSENSQKTIIDENDTPSENLPGAELYSDNPAPSSSEKQDKAKNSGGSSINVRPLEIRLDDGSAVTVTGRIDRIDMFFTDDKKSYVRVVDYKSKAKDFNVFNAKRGVNIQMLLYLFALLDANSGLLPGGISYIPSASSGALKDRMSAFRLLVMNHHQNGLYVRDENTDDETERFADFLIEKINGEEGNSLDEKTIAEIKKAFVPEGENAPDADEFKELRDACTLLLQKNFSDIFSGNIEALPIKYKETVIKTDGGSASKKKLPCKYCRFNSICRNAGETVIDLTEKPTEEEQENGDEKNEQ